MAGVPFLCNPLAGGREKSFAEQMNFWHQFQFSMCFPEGAHSLGHRLGSAPRNKGISDFHCVKKVKKNTLYMKGYRGDIKANLAKESVNLSKPQLP